MAALDVATTLTNLRTIWAGMSSWQSICGVSTTAEAAKRIVIGGTVENVEIFLHSSPSHP